MFLSKDKPKELTASDAMSLAQKVVDATDVSHFLEIIEYKASQGIFHDFFKPTPAERRKLISLGYTVIKGKVSGTYFVTWDPHPNYKKEEDN